MRKLTHMLLAGTLILACSSCGVETTANYQVIPLPQEVALSQESPFNLNDGTIIASPEHNELLKRNAEFLAEYISQSTGHTLQTEALAPGSEAPKGAITLGLDPAISNREGYVLTVKADRVTLNGQTENGVFYGIQTLRKSIPAETKATSILLPAGSIQDEPRFSYRGMHLDVGRHFFPIEFIKKYIDLLALHNMNTFHWHLTEDQGWRIEIKKYPKLTEIGAWRDRTVIGRNTEEYDNTRYGGFYTQEQAKEIVKYAEERYITVIPEVDLPGHMLAALAAYPEMGCTGGPYEVCPRWGVFEDVLCIGNEKSMQFLEDVMAEIIDIFPSKYIHIGGDEAPRTRWEKCPKCQARIRTEKLKADKNHTAEDRLQSYCMTRIEKLLNSKGRQIIGWDEILEGDVAPNATVMSWRGESGGIEAAKQHHDVIMSPNTYLYFDYYQSKDVEQEPEAIGGYLPLERVYSYEPMPASLTPEEQKYIKGVQANHWSEYMYNTDIMEYRMYPRMLAVSEIAWTPLDKKDYKDFERRINNAYVRLDGHDVNYHIPQPEQPNGSCNFVAFVDSTSLTFKTTRPETMVYTLDGTDPTPLSTQYTEPIKVTETTTLKIRTVLPSGKMSPVRNITVEKQALAPAKVVEKTTPGLKMKMADGTFFKASELNKATEWKEMTVKSLRDIRSQVESTESMRGVKQYGAIATGYVDIPEDGVYYFTTNNDEVWIDGKLLISNEGEVKRFSRNDKSVALAKGLHELKVVFLGHIIGGWPSLWDDASISIRKADQEKFTPIKPEQLFY